QNLQELRDHAQRCGTNITKLKQALNQQLGELAKAALNLPQERFRLSQALVEGYLGEELDETSLGYLALRLGWLNRVGRDGRGDAIFAFYHATFQEYFAALAVEDWDYFLPKDHVNCPVEGKRYRIFEPQWKQVILLWLGRGDIGDEEKEGFIRALVEFKDGVRDLYGYQAFFLAAAGINEFKACSLAAEIVNQLVKWGFGYFNTEKQEWRTFLDPIKEGARKAISETIRPLTISALIDILDHCRDESTRKQAAESLEKIDPRNPDVIVGLLEVIRTTENESSRMQAAWSLGQIDPGNPDAITGLLEIIRTVEVQRHPLHTPPWLQREEAFGRLSRIGQGNPDAIAGLLEVIRTTEDEFTRCQAVRSLGEIGVGNPNAIAGLLEVIRTTENENTRSWAATNLGKIDPGNPNAIAGLLEVIRTTENGLTRCQAAASLGKINSGNPEAIAGLLEVIRTTEDEFTRCQAAASLEEIGVGNPEAIAGLVKVIKTTENEYTRKAAAENLQKIITTPEQYAWAVSALKDYLSDEVYQNDFKRFEVSYKVIWNFAENLPYPEFYQAWHHPSTTSHPEVEDNTPVASTPFTQQCNLALLPQILNQANPSHPLNRQIICIDGSRFSDPSNPALQIYTTLKKAGCPPINDKPRTIAELQAYGEDELSDQAIALILYEEPTDPPPQGFDIAVLNQLARFSHPPIAVVLPERLTDCRLPQFLESDPNLVTTILQWLQNLER
ncbi:HEAT repeat domain-containing protein, partial [Laspinema sp. D1]|uniref:HEAT repeat domain-containing protein n=1 Tax=Laspinema palackyanum TaxID=3231601 RepID=UPI00348CBF2D|nr:HEAT repeat domain-containing protein [Laspinema sp. D2b]